MTMSPASLPNFTDIDIPTLPERLEALLDDHRARIAQLVSIPRQHDWQSLMAPLEELDDHLSKFWSPVSHLNGVMNSEQLRKVYDACIPLLTRYYSDLGQNRALYQAVSDLAASPDFAGLTQAQLGERVVSCIVPLDGQSLSTEDIRQFARQFLAAYKVPKTILFMTEKELPMTGSAKVRRADVKAMVTRRLAADAQAVPNDHP